MSTYKGTLINALNLGPPINKSKNFFPGVETRGGLRCKISPVPTLSRHLPDGERHHRSPPAMASSRKHLARFPPLALRTRSISLTRLLFSRAVLLEQQEKLRRHVDEWRFRSRAALSDLGACSPSTSVSSDPVRLRVAPADPAGAGAASLLTAAAAEDNVAVSKFVAVLSHSCLEISRFSDAVRRAKTHSFISNCNVWSLGLS